MKKKVLFVSHCMTNIASKVISNKLLKDDTADIERKKFIMKAIEEDVCIIQLPCPEFTMYGSSRWGHVKNQFDNPFFREHCEKILAPIITQMKEYCHETDKFQVLGIIGIEGSPSCGVSRTCKGEKWKGEFSGHKNLSESLATICEAKEAGVLFEVLEEMLSREGIDLEIQGFNKLDTSNIYALLEK